MLILTWIVHCRLEVGGRCGGRQGSQKYDSCDRVRNRVPTTHTASLLSLPPCRPRWNTQGTGLNLSPFPGSTETV